MKKLFITTAICFSFCINGFSQSPGQIKILFDCTKAETSGNADWVIDADLENLNWNPYAGTGGYHSNPQQYPTPTQTAVTSSTAETYWEGSLSHWAIDCVNKGYWVETLGPYSTLTYGNASNPQDLSNYKIFVVDEPNIIFPASQKTAIMNFVLNGGSLFIISDHTMSDRNGDGNDSPMIWNDFITNNGVQNNAFGLSFDLQNFSQTSGNVALIPADSILHGPMGNVTQVKWTNGTSMTLDHTQNATTKGVVYKTGASTTGTASVLAAYGRVGCGKFASVGDSSIPDDGTGNPNATLYNGYITDAAGNHQRLLMNMTIWLAEGSCSAGINTYKYSLNAAVYPNPMANALTVQLPFEAQKVNVSLTDVLGNVVMSNTTSGSLINLSNINLSAGVYMVKIVADGKTQITKVIKD